MKQTVRVGAVQAAPIFLDRLGSIEKVVAIIKEAGELGVQILGFPEGFVPGHPGWMELHPFDSVTQQLAKKLFKESVEIESGHLEPIQKQCAESGVHVVLGLCEKIKGSTGTLFNSQVHISSEGEIVCLHQKYVPTIGERLVHAPGRTGIGTSSETSAGKVSSLICGDNCHPLAVYATATEYPIFHVASWPQHFSPELSMNKAVEIASRGLAYSLKCFVLNSVTRISEQMISDYGHNGAEEFLRNKNASGRSSIVGPSGQIIAQAESEKEQIVVADLNPDDVIIPKMVHDVAGHYDRPELFVDLLVRRGRNPIET